MNSSYYVKNRLTSTLGILFSIMIGFVLSEHVKNTVYLIEDKMQTFSIVFLSVSIFFFLFLSAFETFMDFDLADRKIRSKDVFSELITYMIWFAQFFPFYSMVYILVKPDENEISRCQVVSSSFAFVYLFYCLYQAIKLFIDVRRELGNKKEIIRHIVFYAFLQIIYWTVYFTVGYAMSKNGYFFVGVVCLVTTILYIYYWKKYYLSLLYERV